MIAGLNGQRGARTYRDTNIHRCALFEGCATAKRIAGLNGQRGARTYRDINMDGQTHTLLGIYGVYTVFLAGKSPYIRSYTVEI